MLSYNDGLSSDDQRDTEEAIALIITQCETNDQAASEVLLYVLSKFRQDLIDDDEALETTEPEVENDTASSSFRCAICAGDFHFPYDEYTLEEMCQQLLEHLTEHRPVGYPPVLAEVKMYFHKLSATE